MDEMVNILEQTNSFVRDLYLSLEKGIDSVEEYMQKITLLAEVLKSAKVLIPQNIMSEYDDFFASFEDFCVRCQNASFMMTNVDNMADSLVLISECFDDIVAKCKQLTKCCSCCGEMVVYQPISDEYVAIGVKNGNAADDVCETLNEQEYSCPKCGASDKDRLIVSFLKKCNLDKAKEKETRVLQFAPTTSVERWIKIFCPQVTYESTDLRMSNVTYQADIQNMISVPNETYDLIICSNILEQVQDDIKALREMSRILKDDGRICFLVPVSLNADRIDEEWGLPEEENSKRFGHRYCCRRYNKNGLVERLEKVFYVHQLGKEYFGDDIFSECALTETSTLYVLTKNSGVNLDMGEKLCVNEELCEYGPLVSVLLPCYNHERYVAEAIESVLNQTYKNIEIIVADDASTDGSVNVLKKYEKYFKKVIYFSENGGGRSYDLRPYAEGKYIALMHSDDIWDKNKIALQIDYMERHNECGVCFTWCKYCDEKKNEIIDPIFLQKNRNRKEWMRFFWKNGNALCNPSSVFRAEFWSGIPRYGGACRQLPDFFKWVGLIQECDFHIVPHVLIHMRKHATKETENTSAATKHNLFRSAVEMANNWPMVLKNMDDDFFASTFREEFILTEACSKEELKCERYFMMKKHPSMFMQSSALAYFNEIYPECKEVLKSKYKYTKQQYANDMLNTGIVQNFLTEE